MYVISYDIVADKLRNKIAKTLEDFGRRVQYSVFECNLDEAKYRELHARLALLMTDVEEGSIREYQICQTCEKRTVVIGVEKRTVSQEDVYVI